MSSLSTSRAEGDGTTYAVTSSPHLSLGTPATATSCTAGCASSTSSTSRGYTLNPPVMISSLIRPRIASVPSAPISPTSPVRKKPSGVNASAVASGLRQYPLNTWPPLSSTSSSSPSLTSTPGNG